MHLKPIKDQVVAVVGASSGIGRATALRLADRGAKVVVAARSQPGLESLVEEIQRKGGQATLVVADVGDYAQVKSIADRAVEIYGHLDTWVQPAAVSLYATFEQTTPEEFRRVVDVNLTGQAYGAMAALPHLRREGRGALIHVTSIEAFRGFPLQSAYSASKHGIRGFLEALRVELQREGVSISVAEIIPASINTPLFEKARTKLGVEPAPIPPVYKPEAVADAILYAAENPTREIIVGGAGLAIVEGQKWTPPLLDVMQRWLGFRLQESNRPEPENSPNNLFEPVEGYDRVEGNYSRFAMPSLYTWLVTHRAVRQITMAGLALGATALISMRMLKSTGQPRMLARSPRRVRKRRQGMQRLIRMA